MTYDPTTAARLGALYLDEHVPGWYERVDTDTLDIESCRHCTLSQVTGDLYGMARERLDLDAINARRLGFVLPNTERQHYAALTEAWKGEIEARRAEDFVDGLKHAFSDLPPIRLEDAPWNWEIPA